MDRLLVVICIVITIVVPFYLFFWNRLIGWIIGFVLRQLLWKKWNVWIDMDAFQFSFLAGRLMIKDFRYHSTNQSIRIINFHLTWRYWFWRSRLENESTRIEIPGEEVEEKSDHLPCRLKAVADGVEWFIYNRNAAYDDILRHLHPDAPELLSQRRPETRATSVVEELVEPENQRAWMKIAIAILTYPLRLLRPLIAWLIRQLPSLQAKDILPIAFEVTRGAITLGNDSMPSIFIANFKRATGTYGLQPSRSRLDPYKQVFAFRFTEVRLYTRVNRDWDGTMRERGKEVVDEIKRMSFMSKTDSISPDNFFTKAFHNIAPRLFRSHLEPESPTVEKKWEGLSRYQMHNEKEDLTAQTREYAKLSTILETPELDFTYYADVAGLVPDEPVRVGKPGLEAMDVGNGDLAPEWGFDFVIHGGQINYGPWADRQRRALQETLFPATFYPRQQTQRRVPGQPRLHVALKILVEIRQEIKLRLPTREASKNWRYDALGDLGPNKLNSRPFGWLDATIGPNSTITYDMAMVAHERGYDNMLQVHLDSLIIASSVNQARFLAADLCRVSCDMPSPLTWNAPREWTFDISLSKPTVQLLRDHVTLITDLVKDWTSGPPTEYFRFIPITYTLRMSLRDTRFGVYLNDHNVIDYPLDNGQNTMLWLKAPMLTTAVSIPSLKYRPLSSIVSWDVQASPVDLTLVLPDWNTNSIVATKATQSVGHVGSFQVKGSLLSWAEVAPGNVDVMKLEINVRAVLFKAFGRTVHHLLRLRENYFGNFTNFSTRLEYMEKYARGAVGDPMLLKYRKGKSNMFQLGLQVDVEDAVMLMPRELHDLRSATSIAFPTLQILINLHDHYMDLTLNIGPQTIDALEDCTAMHTKSDFREPRSQGLVLSDLDICANRLFGPPPQNASYFGLWEVRLGQVFGSASTELVQSLVDSANSFSTGFSNTLDGIADQYKILYDVDVTYFSVTIKSVNVAWVLPQAAVQLSLPDGMRFDSNNMPGQYHWTTKSIAIPAVRVRTLLAPAHSPPIKGGRSWIEVGCASFDFYCDIYGAPLGWRALSERQKLFVEFQDAITRRVPWVYDPGAAQPSSYRRDHTLLLPVVIRPKPREPREDDASESVSGTGTYTSATSSGSASSTFTSSEDSSSEHVVSFTTPGRRASRAITDPLDGDDEDLTSGDESDESDADENSTIDSILEDGDIDFLSYRSTLSLYRSAPPGRFSEAPFILETPNRSSSSPIADSITPSARGDRQSSGIPPSLPADESTETTVIRVQSKSISELFITPLVAVAFRTFLEATYNSVPTRERELDTLYRAFASSVKPEKLPSRTLFEARLARGTVAILQAMPLDQPLRQQLMRVDNGRPRSHALGLITATLSEGRCVGTAANGQNSVHASYGSAAVGVRIGKSPLRLSQPALPSGHFFARSSALLLSKSDNGTSISPSIGDLQLDLPDWSLLVTLRLISSLVLTFKPLAPALQLKQEATAHHRAETFTKLLGLCQELPLAADPLSRTQLSFMVNAGRAKELRADPTLEILLRLQAAARTPEANSIFGLLEPIPTAGNWRAHLEESMITTLGYLWNRGLIELHPDEVPTSFVYRQLFPSTDHGSSGSAVFPLLFHLTYRGVTINLGASLSTRNQLELGPGHLRLQIAERTFTQAPTLAENKSSTSLPVAPPRLATHVVLTASLATFRITLHPSLFSVIEGVLRFKNEVTRKTPPTETIGAPSQSARRKPRVLVLETFMDLENFEVRALAQVLSVGLRLKGGHISNSLILGIGGSLEGSRILRKTNTSVLAGFRELSIQARSPHNETDETSHDRSILAALTLLDSQLFVLTDLENLRATSSLNSMKLSVPRSALKLYNFVKQWEAEYLPSYDAMFRKVLSEIDEPNAGPKRPKKKSSMRFKSIDIQSQINLMSVFLHVMHGTWLSWSFEDTLVYATSKDLARIAYGVQLASQRITISGEPDEPGAITPTTSRPVKFGLPSLRLSGVWEGNSLEAALIVDHVRIMLKPQYMDDILVVQQKFGTDFNEIIDVLASNSSTAKTNVSQPKSPRRITIEAGVRLEGFTIGIQGPTSTQYLLSPEMSASYRSSPSTGTHWRLNLQKLELSLVHNMRALHRQREQYNSASMSLNCYIHNDAPVDADEGVEYLTISISQVHAVMAPAAISELGNLIDHVQAEMLQRKRDRAAELAEIKDKTRHVIRKFEGPEPRAATGNAFRNRMISFAVENIGIAFPLSIQTSLATSPIGAASHHNVEPVPAFLFSISSLSFASQREESGSARMSNFAFQFVPSFDQRRPDHFSSSSHRHFNRMLYPIMAADIRSSTTGSSRVIQIRAAVSGFELDVTPTLPAYIFALIDVYRHGKEQLERFLPQTTNTNDLSSSTAELPKQEAVSPTLAEIPTSEVVMSLEFESGRVQFHVDESSSDQPPSPLIPLDLGVRNAGRSNNDDDDIFLLPTVSVWVDYRATPASLKASLPPDTPSSHLTFSSIIHTSSNTIQPSMLPFITEITRQIEARLSELPPPPTLNSKSSFVNAATDTPQLSAPSGVVGNMEMTFSLRIDQSNLAFSCAPDANVLLGLHWKSGGFVLRVAPQGQEISLVGSVEGISTVLKHGYLVDDCVSASARGLTFAVTLGHGEEQGVSVNTLSIVIDTEIIGGIRFARLQDFLCFKAVWLDRIPVFEAAIPPTAPPSPIHPTQDRRVAPKPFITSILVQVESLQLDVDLGQSITKLTLDLRPVIVRVRLTNEFAEISVVSQLLKLDAARALSGRVSIPNIAFETMRRRRQSRGDHQTLLELAIRTGELNASVNFEGKRILLLRCDPLTAIVSDHWDITKDGPNSLDQQVRLSFLVRGGNIRAGARVMTASELILLGGRVRALIDLQRDNAALESKVFAISRAPKPQNPLSQVATAMLQSARSKFKEAEHLDILVIQHMTLEVAQIRLGVFNETDTRYTQFEADGVHGELTREVRADANSSVRDLQLSLLALEVRTGDVPAQDKWLEFLNGPKVFTMPEMAIAMHSTEYTTENRIDYDFKSTFPAPKSKGGQRSLYVALDFHKYEQLVTMQTAFKEAIEKALAEIGQPTPSVSAISSGTATELGARPSLGKRSALSIMKTADLPAGLEEVGRGTSAAETIQAKVQELEQAAQAASALQPGERRAPEQSSLSPSVIQQGRRASADGVRTDSTKAPDLSTVKVGMRGLTYHCLQRTIETPKLHQLGAASPDLETFGQWTNISIRDSLPVWVHEYATVPIEQLMRTLLEVYIKQLKSQNDLDDVMGRDAAAGGVANHEQDAVPLLLLPAKQAAPAEEGPADTRVEGIGK
ncbi:hypothetical protein DL93DRAFT_2163795 [Clavulina sp. PMI_390]|nr:hypothetical protein DL93DRAFT_2163795 [Clavulina sp. PMI_390]